MAHFVIENPFGLDRTMRGCASPRTPRAAFLNSPQLFRKQEAQVPMWINFKGNHRGSTHSQGAGFPRRGLQRLIARQESTQSTKSVRSNKSSPGNNLKAKLEELQLKTNGTEWQKEQDYKLIRERRKRIEKLVGKKLRVVRRLYIPSVLVVLLGIVVVFCASIRVVGEGTVFYTYREQFVIIGPIILLIGLVLLLTAVGLESHNEEKLKSEGIETDKPIIHPDFLNERNKFKTAASHCSGNPNSAVLEKQRLLRHDKNQSSKETFLCSSITSASSIQSQERYGIDLKARWARAMALSFSSSDASDGDDVTITIPVDQADDSLILSKDSGYPRSINGLPNIVITEADEVLTRSLPLSSTTDTINARVMPQFHSINEIVSTS